MRIDPSPATATQNAQTVAAYAAAYDYVALVATPTREHSAGLDAWLTTLGARGGRTPGDPDIRRKVVIMLRNARRHPNIDGRAAEAPDAQLLARQMRALQLDGVLNFGYVSDDAPRDDPPLARIAPALSLREYPVGPGNTER